MTMATYGKQRRRGRTLPAALAVFQDDSELPAQHRRPLSFETDQPLLTTTPSFTITSDDELDPDSATNAALALPMPSFSTNNRYRSLSLPRKALAANKQRIDEAPDDELETSQAMPQAGSTFQRYTSKLLLDKTTNDKMAPGRDFPSRKLEISDPYDVVKSDLPLDLTTAIAAHKKHLHPSSPLATPLLPPISPLSRQDTSTDLDLVSKEYQPNEPRVSPITTRRSPSKGRRVLIRRSEKAQNNMTNESGFLSKARDFISRSFSSSSSQSISQGHLQITPSYANLPEELSVVDSKDKLQRHYGYSNYEDSSLTSKAQRRARSVGARGKAKEIANTPGASIDTTMQNEEDFKRHRPQTIMGNSPGAYEGFAAWASESIRAIGIDAVKVGLESFDHNTNAIKQLNTVNTGYSAHNVQAGYTNDEAYYRHHDLTIGSSISTAYDPAAPDECRDIPFMLHTPGGSLELHHTLTPGVDFAHYHYKKDHEDSNAEMNKGCLCQQRAANYLDTEISQLADFDHSLGPVSAFSCANSPLEQHPNVLDFAEPPEWYKMSMKTKAMNDMSASSAADSQASASHKSAQGREDTPPIPSVPPTAYAMYPGRRHVQISTPPIPQIHVNRASDNSKRSSGDAEIGGNSPRKSEWKKGKTFAHVGNPSTAFQVPSPHCDEMDSYLPTASSNSRGASFDINMRDTVMRNSDDSFNALLLEPSARDSNDSSGQRSGGKHKRPSKAYRKSVPMYLRPSTEMDIDDIDELSVDQPYAIGLAK